MRIAIRVPGHPLALETVTSGLARLGKPEVREGDGAWWVEMRVPDEPAALNEAMEVGVRLNVLLMRAWRARGHDVPSVYELATSSGFRYKPEPKGREWWQTWIDNVAEGSGDCEDLAMHQAGFYRFNGLPAKAVTKKTGRHVYHAVVEHVGGVIEDPSLPLGLARQRIERAIARAKREGRNAA